MYRSLTCDNQSPFVISSPHCKLEAVVPPTRPSFLDKAILFHDASHFCKILSFLTAPPFPSFSHQSHGLTQIAQASAVR